MLQIRTRPPVFNKKFVRLVVAAIIATLLVSYVGFSIAGATYFLTAPRYVPPITPTSRYNLPYEDVEFQSTASDKITLRGWWIPKSGADRAIIMLHGQSGNRTHQLAVANRLWQNNFNVLVIDLRGHGKSDGDHHTLGYLEKLDVVGAVNWLKAKGFKPAKIGAIGWSLGAATTILAMAETTDIKAGVSDSGYAEAATLLRVFYPGTLLAAQVIQGIDLEQVKPVEAIKKLGQRHVMIIQGDLDSHVPVSDAYRLKEAGGENAELWLATGATHAAIFAQSLDLYMQKVVGFFDRELK